MAEDQVGKIAGDTPFVEPAFLDDALMKCARVDGAGKKCFASENQRKHAQPVTAFVFVEGKQVVIKAREVEKYCKIDFEELLRDGAGTLVVKPPARAVGEDAPAQFTGRQVVYPPEIAEHLR